MTPEMIRRAMDTVEWTEERLADLNAVLAGPDETPTGSYCVGMLDVCAAMAGLIPDRDAYKGAMRCQTVEEGELFAENWVKRAKATRKEPGDAR